MKFLDYLNKTNIDKDFNILRSIRIGLIDFNNGKIEEVCEKFSLNNLIIDLNKELKRNYQGKLKFGFCLESICEISDLNLSDFKERKIRNKFYECMNKLLKEKEKLEKI